MEQQCEKHICVFKERAGKPGGGKGILIGYDRSFILSTESFDHLCYENENTVQPRFTGIVLNDMGGGAMNIENDFAATLRAQTKHHEQIVLFQNAAPVAMTISGKQQSLVTTLGVE